MNLYLSGVGKYGEFLLGLPSLRFLVSYYYLRQKKSADWYTINFATEHNIPLMLDCGAWSAMTHGETIDNQEYIAFCKEHGDIFEVIVSLDVIGDSEKTRINHLEMKNAGIESITTFHINSPFEELDNLLKEENYIGVGMAGKWSRVATKRWLKYINRLNDNGIKFHGFGVTKPDLLQSHNWHSVDGTTWMTAAARFGRLMINLGNGRIKWIAIQDKKELTENWDLVKDDIKEGWDLETGRTKEYERIALRYNARSLIELVEFCSKNKSEDRQEFLL